MWECKAGRIFYKPGGLETSGYRGYAGIFRETVTDALAELKSSEIIKIERRRITILNRTRLEDRAG